MKRLIISDLIKRLKYYVIITFLSMTVNFSNRRIIYRCKSKTSKSGKKQFHFNVPNSPFRSGIINPDKEYFIYYIEETLEQNKVVTNDLEKLKLNIYFEQSKERDDRNKRSLNDIIIHTIYHIHDYLIDDYPELEIEEITNIYQAINV